MKNLLALLLLIPLCAPADQNFPKPGWKDAPDPLASPDAEPGGEITVFAGQSPKSLNWFLAQTSFGQMFFGMLYQGLITSDPVTLENTPWLADRWTISDDKLVYTFHLNEKAKWSDGKPVTADDVKWTFDTLLDPKNLTGQYKVSLGRFSKLEVLDERTVRFTAKEVHWKNLQSATFFVLPRHVFEGEDFNKVNFEFPVVSGPYRLGEHKEQFYVEIKRRDDYWNKDAPSMRGIYNFDTIRFRFYGSYENGWDAFKKGEIDVFQVGRADWWVNETKGEKYDKNWIVKQKIHNYAPTYFRGFAMNMRRPPFDDIRVRKAMAMLLDRHKMNRDLMHNSYTMLTTYHPGIHTPDNPNKNVEVNFDPERARQLLDESGWKVNPETGIREKDGKKFEVEFLSPSASLDRFLAIYIPDLKQAGIVMKNVQKDWASWSKDMDEFNFEVTNAGFGGVVPAYEDPEPIWASRLADLKASFNITGLRSDRIDAIIEKQKVEFDVATRLKLLTELDQILYNEHPYALQWTLDYKRLVYWNKFGTPKTVLGKYGDTDDAPLQYWWIDPDSEADLEDAQADKTSLPGYTREIKFDEIFK